MGWITVYIRGKFDFKGDVLRNLENSGIKFMPGTSDERYVSLFWMDEKDTLRDFKKAIGSKTVFKYRLRFYTSVEEFIESKSNLRVDEFTPHEQSMIREMSNRELEQRMGTDN